MIRARGDFDPTLFLNMEEKCFSKSLVPTYKPVKGKVFPLPALL